DVAGRESTPLARMHALMAALNEALAFDPDATDAATSAAKAFAKRRGVCQDFANVFVACARTLDIPSRYVSGYLRGDDDEFDPVHALCPNEAYVRVAVALDSLGASPVRGARVGGGTEEMTVHVRVEGARAQSQS